MNNRVYLRDIDNHPVALYPYGSKIYTFAKPLVLEDNREHYWNLEGIFNNSDSFTTELECGLRKLI
jgi:hypothetical protein